MIAPMKCPPYGVSLPVELVEIRDGDTIVVRLRGMALTWAVRLIDCWCPELHRGSASSKQKAADAVGYLRELFANDEHAGDLRWFVPLPEVKPDAKNINILGWLSFDRVPGYLFLGPDRTLNRMLVVAGFASTTKKGPLGE